MSKKHIEQIINSFYGHEGRPGHVGGSLPLRLSRKAYYASLQSGNDKAIVHAREAHHQAKLAERAKTRLRIGGYTITPIQKHYLAYQAHLKAAAAHTLDEPAYDLHREAADEHQNHFMFHPSGYGLGDPADRDEIPVGGYVRPIDFPPEDVDEFTDPKVDDHFIDLIDRLKKKYGKVEVIRKYEGAYARAVLKVDGKKKRFFWFLNKWRQA